MWPKTQVPYGYVDHRVRLDELMTSIVIWLAVVVIGLVAVKYNSRLSNLNERIFGKDPIGIQGTEFAYIVVGGLLIVFGGVISVISIIDYFVD